MMRVAIPNKGALNGPAMQMLKDAGFAVLDSPDATLRARCEDGRVEYLFVRAQDVTRYVENGAAYAGITGRDMLLESSSTARRVMDLGFGRCEIALAVPEGSGIRSAKDLSGKKIATKLSMISSSYLSRNGVDAELVLLYGAVEIAPSAGLADAIIDQVQTGRTLKANRMKKVEKITDSSAWLVATGRKEKGSEQILEEIAISLAGVIKAKNLKYVAINAPSKKARDQIIGVLPSMESPTVLKLAKSEEWAVQTVVETSQLATVIRKVKSAGGKDILVMSLDKAIP